MARLVAAVVARHEQSGAQRHLAVVPRVQVGAKLWVDGAVAVQRAGDLAADGAVRVGVAQKVDAVLDRAVEARRLADRVQRDRQPVEAVRAKVARRVGVAVVCVAARAHHVAQREGVGAPVPVALGATVGLIGAQQPADLGHAALARALLERLRVLVGDGAHKGARRRRGRVELVDAAHQQAREKGARLGRDGARVGRVRRGARVLGRALRVAAVEKRDRREPHQRAVARIFAGRVERGRGRLVRFHRVERARDVAAEAARAAAPAVLAEGVVVPAKPPRPEEDAAVGAVEAAPPEQRVGKAERHRRVVRPLARVEAKLVERVGVAGAVRGGRTAAAHGARQRQQAGE
mmetsp:Transcript_45459/g.126084  ORF Transcript_45459/g.126084 Transcript_45459/m.126084 type:complete len:348 (+) Transcript_45459:191-1234(+)